MHHLVLVAALLAAAVPHPPPEPVRPARSGASNTRVLVEARDGTVTERRLVDFETADLRDVGAAWVRFGDARPPDPAQADSPVRVELVGGDVLRGRVAGGGGEELSLELLGEVRVPVSIEVMRSLVFPDRLPLAGLSALEAPDEGDRLYRRIADNLDRIDGAVESFESEGIRFDSILGSRLFTWDEVGALFVETFVDDPTGGGDAGGRVVCDLVDGSRVRGTLEKLDRTGCRLVVAGGKALVLPISILSEVSLDDGTIAFLSDLVPDATGDGVEGSPFGDDLGATWPHQMDRSVMGSPLVAGGRTYNRGIGVHAPSRLTFDLGGSWDELRGMVAVDDEVLRLPERGSVVFRIHVDGSLAWESKVVRGGAAPVRIPPVELNGAEELVLECDMSVDFAVADRADWLRVVLVRDE
jgi:hypothetical protein